MASPPKVRVFELCEAAVVDRMSGKPTLVGLFDRIEASTFPATYGPFAVFAKLTGLNGWYRFRLRFVAPDLTTVVTEAEEPELASVTDPWVSVLSTWNVPRIALPTPGRYAVRLLYNDQIPEEIPLLVEARP